MDTPLRQSEPEKGVHHRDEGKEGRKLLLREPGGRPAADSGMDRLRIVEGLIAVPYSIVELAEEAERRIERKGMSGLPSGGRCRRSPGWSRRFPGREGDPCPWISISSLRAPISAVSPSHVRLRTAIAALRAPLAELWTAIAALRVAIAGLRVAVAGLRTAIAALRVAIAGLRGVVARLRVAIAGLRVAVAELGTAIVALRAAIAGLRVAVAGLRGVVARLRVAVAGLRAAMARLRIATAWLRGSMERLRGALESEATAKHPMPTAGEETSCPTESRSARASWGAGRASAVGAPLPTPASRCASARRGTAAALRESAPSRRPPGRSRGSR